ncbi:septum site-determining protein MinC [Mobilisporobacter senegalensis]|uniref:Probable septum site-determining protein MinC n=1 Tax=Mobilisporobacter senegalensis TaxID=1329262 RepID=A0A3N1XR46_9FIRM|nr:septum site-determining protein MinC [Mobilisporobacter senegalensis]ROR29143.1 septum site-determining protein MinC [Mobilisporobacter senegalensis]
MNNSVVIKAYNGGIVAVLDPDLSFEDLKVEIASKFKASAKFFNNAQMAISFEGRTLSDEEKIEILGIISENSDLHIVCIVEDDPDKDKQFQKSINEKLMELNTNTGQFYKGNLRSGQVLEVETSIIIIGDVNPGAKVVSKGNIIILGSLKGNVFAGATGNEKSFVVALDMNPVQIRIADVIARAPDKPVKNSVKETKIAFVEDGNIYIEPLDKNVIGELTL